MMIALHVGKFFFPVFVVLNALHQLDTKRSKTVLFGLLCVPSVMTFNLSFCYRYFLNKISIMSKTTNDDIESSILSVAQHNSLSKTAILLYALRFANSDEDWKIQALFGNHIKFDFTIDRTLICQEVSSQCHVCYMWR
jgi:hypothetical protein